MANLGYVGLGVMGGRMADRLMSKGHVVTGTNRTKSKAQWLIDRGMKWGDTPRAVAEKADIVFSMVTDSAALEAIANGPDGIVAGLGPGKVLIDMSTVSPAASKALAEKVRAKGADMVFALETFWPTKDGTSAARIEEEIVVTPTGHEVITRFPAEQLLVAGAPFVTVAGTLPTVRETEAPPNPEVVKMVAAAAKAEGEKVGAGR